MKLINWLKDILGFGEDDFDDIELNFSSESAESLMQSLANASKKRRTLNMNDKEQREQYVREYCDMMAVASKDVEAQKIEYQQVTERLADLEELEKLPVTDKSQVRIRANKVIKIEQEDSRYTRPAKKITESQYREMERMAKDIPAVLEKMKRMRNTRQLSGVILIFLKAKKVLSLISEKKTARKQVVPSTLHLSHCSVRLWHRHSCLC